MAMSPAATVLLSICAAISWMSVAASGLFVFEREEANLADGRLAGAERFFVPSPNYGPPGGLPVPELPGSIGSSFPAGRLSPLEKSARIRGCAGPRPAPAINRLIVVSHDAQRAMRADERLNERELDAVGVLIFVDLHMVEALPGVVPGLRENRGTRRSVNNKRSSKSTSPAAFKAALVAPIGCCRQKIEIVFDAFGGSARGRCRGSSSGSHG